MTQAELVARICITALIAFALFVAIPVSFGALRKWKAAIAARTKAQADYDLSLRLGKLEDSDRDELMSRPEPTTTRVADLEKLHAQHHARRVELGVPYPTLGEMEADMVSGLSKHAGTFQAPAEVWWGLAALVAATAAGIWGTWL
ncbi:hypothetical protein BH11ACT5_BH11ACT5_19930 [soil metagenome]